MNRLFLARGYGLIVGLIALVLGSLGIAFGADLSFLMILETRFSFELPRALIMW
jgi:hypothetical protein